VAWDGRLTPPRLRVRFPAGVAGEPVRVSLSLEGESERHLPSDRLATPVSGPVRRTERVEGMDFVETSLALPGLLPQGYHRLTVEVGSVRGSAMVVSAPSRGDRDRHRSWGVFMPLHALRSARSWGVGDLTDLEELVVWVGSLGGAMVATLPLLAGFLGEEPFEPAPYSPASRLFWNELFVDPERAPELSASREARRLVSSGELRRELEALRSEPLVDYRRAMAVKRRVLEALCGHLFAEPAGKRAGELREWARRHPLAEEYARFRATTERRASSWWSWPKRERGGRLAGEGDDPAAYRYHLYVQWLMAEQMGAISAKAKERGSGLYFDFPLGVNPDGFDTWRERDAFALAASAGAPPDPFFTGGQDWGFPPLHPERIREQGYAYPIACLRHLLEHAGVLRIDHVMGLHRLYWVPHGLDPRSGAYVRYRPEEWYAILALEAHRSGAVVVGEDLGTVPTAVRHAMARHHVYRSFVLQYEARADGPAVLPVPPRESQASLNTHDMPPFAAFWRGLELQTRVEQGWLSEGDAREQLERRARLRLAIVNVLRSGGWLPDEVAGPAPIGRRIERAVLEAALSFLAAGPAALVLVNLEDLWGETRPQNVPGTVHQYPNWRRKAKLPLEAFRLEGRVVGTLATVNRLRMRGSPP
jgi:4-alpha-glucanotransferase